MLLVSSSTRASISSGVWYSSSESSVASAVVAFAASFSISLAGSSTSSLVISFDLSFDFLIDWIDFIKFNLGNINLLVPLDDSFFTFGALMDVVEDIFDVVIDVEVVVVVGMLMEVVGFGLLVVVSACEGLKPRGRIGLEVYV